ncbi:UNVERIFIED_CONTAM: Cuticle protein 16.8 [Trichonephila clavipes]
MCGKRPQPFDFGYETNDNYGTTTFRKENGDGHGRVQGSYGYKDLNGIERVVEYVADEHGYRADIKTNEPGTESQNPANVVLHASPVVVDAPKAYAEPRPLYQAPQYALLSLNKPSSLVSYLSYHSAMFFKKQ